MFSVHLKAGLKFKIENSVYEILKLLENGEIQVEDKQFSDIKIFTKTELIHFLNIGLLKFEAKGKNVKFDNTCSINTSFDFEDIENSKYKNIAIFRLEVIRPLLEIPYTRRNTKDIEKRVNETNASLDSHLVDIDGIEVSKKVSKASIYRWLSDYEKSGRDIRALLPSYHLSGGKNKSRLNPIIEKFVHEIIEKTYLNQQKITVLETYNYLINQIGEYNEFAISKVSLPSYSTLARYVQKIPEFELVAKRIGKRTAEQNFKPIGQGVKVSYPLERVEIDSTDLDIIILSPEGTVIGRPHFIAAIDKFSRTIVGFSLGFGGVGWPEVMQCLRHILTGKSYVKEKYPFVINEWNAFGVPKTIVVDNGLGFKNNPMKDASYQLGFVLQFAPPRVPEWKGSIERFFGTTNTSLVHNLPGTTRSNPRQLGDDEVPEHNACLPFSVFLGLLHKWIVDVYSQDLNKGAGGIPAKVWDDGIKRFPTAWPNNIDELAILLGRVEFRHIRNKGIELNGLYYNSSDLNKMYIKFSLENAGMKQKFKVKYDPHDIGSIYVYDHIFEQDWIKVPAVDRQYAAGLSEWEHREIRSKARLEFGQVDILALAQAKAFIRSQIDQWTGYNKKKLAKAKKINSTQEIFNQTKGVAATSTVATKVSLEGNLSDNKINPEQEYQIHISDIGTPFGDSSSTPSVIPSYANMNESVSKKIVSMEVKKNRRNRVKKQPTSNLDDKLSLEDLTGFKVLSGRRGQLSE